MHFHFSRGDAPRSNVAKFVAEYQSFERRVNTEFAGFNGTKVVDEVAL